jgi:hypothetical protein
VTSCELRRYESASARRTPRNARSRRPGGLAAPPRPLLTAANRLPELVESLGKANGRPIETDSLTRDNYSLEDHWNDGEAQRLIARGKWNFVVLQQGPSSLPDSRALLIDYAGRFTGEAARAGARTALFMVWPSAARFRDYDGVKLSYETAAKEIGGIFLPAGEAWRAAWKSDPGLRLYGPDGFHPSPLGSALAAVVIFQGLTGQPPERLPRRFAEIETRPLLDAAGAAFSR